MADAIRRVRGREYKVKQTVGLYPTAGTITGFEEKQIRESVPGIRIINLPTRFHAIQVLMPAACAKAVLHFAGEHDGVANHE